MSRIAIDKKTQRDKLTPRREPYWGAPLSRGLFIGFRKLADGGTWIARQRDEDGRQHYESLGHADHVAYDDAVKLARAFGKRVDGGIDTSEVGTVAEACAAYVKDRRREKGDKNADATAALYRCHVNEHRIGAIKLGKLKADDIKAWRAELAMKDASKNRVLSALKAAMNYAVAQRYLGADRSIEWASVKDFVEKARRQVYLPPVERRALLDAMPEAGRPFARALCLLPLRPGAAAQLTVANLDKRHKLLHIDHDKHHAGRIIPLSGAAFDLLAEHCKGKLPGAPIFADTKGAAWINDTWKELFRVGRKAAKLNPATCAYSLRHSTITDMLTGGVDSLTVARIAGTSIQKIEEHYGHLLNQHGALAVEVLARLETAG